MAFLARLRMSFPRNLSTIKVVESVKSIPKLYFSRSAYDPDGKTVTNVLNSDETAPLMINGYSVMGFRLNNGIFVVGPIALFPQSILGWNIEGDHDINEKSLSLFLNLHPKLDVFIIGVSDATDNKLIADTRMKVLNIIRSKGYPKLNLEVMPTEKAVTTFNFLTCEQRFVGAALIPPTIYSSNLDDSFRIEYLTKKIEERDILLA